jgi:hypothetical protein
LLGTAKGRPHDPGLPHLRSRRSAYVLLTPGSLVQDSFAVTGEACPQTATHRRFRDTEEADGRSAAGNHFSTIVAYSGAHGDSACRKSKASASPAPAASCGLARCPGPLRQLSTPRRHKAPADTAAPSRDIRDALDPNNGFRLPTRSHANTVPDHIPARELNSGTSQKTLRRAVPLLYRQRAGLRQRLPQVDD